MQQFSAQGNVSQSALSIRPVDNPQTSCIAHTRHAHSDTRKTPHKQLVAGHVMSSGDVKRIVDHHERQRTASSADANARGHNA